MAETDSRILEYLEEGLFLYGVGKVQESIVRWRKVLELDPRNERAMDYIESAGGDVSQFRQKAGISARSGAPASSVSPPPAPATAPPPPAVGPKPMAPAAPSVATLPMPNVTAPAQPLDVNAFLASTGAAPPVRGTAPPSAPVGGPMPWQQSPPTSPPPAMPSLTTSSTTETAAVRSTVSPPSKPPTPPTPPPRPTPAAAQPPPAAMNPFAFPSALPPTATPPPPASSPAPPSFSPPPPAFNPAPVVAAQQPVPPPVAAPVPVAPPPVAPPPQPPAPPPVNVRALLIAEAGTLFQARDFEKSLELLETIAREHPPVDDQLRQYLDAARNALYEALKTQWPRPDLIPEIRMTASQVMQLKLSPEAGFIFSRVDGVSTVEEILAMGGLDPFTTLRALGQLKRVGVIGVIS